MLENVFIQPHRRLHKIKKKGYSQRQVPVVEVGTNKMDGIKLIITGLKEIRSENTEEKHCWKMFPTR